MLVGERRPADGDLPLPETVQGIIAARLDALRADGEGAAPGRGRGRQGVLARALARRRRDRATVEDAAPRPRAQGVRPARAPLVGRGRDRVRVPARARPRRRLRRRSRARRAPRSTRLAAEWIESLGRGDDRAELLAHHYLAGARVRARGRARHGERSRERARPALRRGRRPSALARRARRRRPLLRGGARALAARRPERPAAARRYGRSADVRRRRRGLRPGRGGRATSSAPRATREAAAEAESAARLRRWLLRGDRAELETRSSRALELAPATEPGRCAAICRARSPRFAMLADDERAGDRARRGGARAGRAARPPPVRAHALNNIALRAHVGSATASGLADLERALSSRGTRRGGSSARSAISRRCLHRLGELDALARDDSSEALELAASSAWASPALVQGRDVAYRLLGGDGTRRRAAARRAFIALRAGGRSAWRPSATAGARGSRSRAATPERAVAWLEQSVEGAREARDLQMLCPTLAISAPGRASSGDAASLALAREVARRFTAECARALARRLAEGAWCVLNRHGRRRRSLAARRASSPTPWVDGGRGALRRRLRRAAEIYAELGSPLLGGRRPPVGRRPLAAQGRAAEADAQARRRSRSSARSARPRTSAPGRGAPGGCGVASCRRSGGTPRVAWRSSHSATPPPTTGRASSPSWASALAATAARRPLSQTVTIGLLGREQVAAAANEPVRHVAAAGDVPVGVLVRLAHVEHLDRVLGDEPLELVERHRLRPLVVGGRQRRSRRGRGRRPRAGRARRARLVLGRRADHDRLLGQEHEARLGREARAVDRHVDRAVRVAGEEHGERAGRRGRRRRPDRRARATARGAPTNGPRLSATIRSMFGGRGGATAADVVDERPRSLDDAERRVEPALEADRRRRLRAHPRAAERAGDVAGEDLDAVAEVDEPAQAVEEAARAVERRHGEVGPRGVADEERVAGQHEPRLVAARAVDDREGTCARAGGPACAARAARPRRRAPRRRPRAARTGTPAPRPGARAPGSRARARSGRGRRGGRRACASRARATMRTPSRSACSR